VRIVKASIFMESSFSKPTLWERISGESTSRYLRFRSENQHLDIVKTIRIDLLGALETTAPSRNREKEAAKAKARAAERFGK
jgi:hypothetical protein